jgi:hypothetical protein
MAEALIVLFCLAIILGLDITMCHEGFVSSVLYATGS